MNGLLSYQIRYYDEDESIPSGVEEVVTHTDSITLDKLQEAVGGMIETMTRFPSPYRKGVSIDGYVNEEGLIFNLPTVMATNDEYGVRVFAGNIVFVGGLDRTGDSVPLNFAEMEYIRERFDGVIFNFAE